MDHSDANVGIVQTNMFITIAFAEAIAIYALVISLLIKFG